MEKTQAVLNAPADDFVQAVEVEEEVVQATEFGHPKGAETTIEFIGDEPKLKIMPRAHDKMWALVHESKRDEIGWFNSCRQRPDGLFVLDDVFVPKQNCSFATTTITEAGIGQLMRELRQAGKKHIINRLSCWGHSHVNMDVFASGTDENQTNWFLRDHVKKGVPFFIRVIANQRGELYCSLYLLNRGVVIDNLELIVPKKNHANRWRAWARNEISKKVTVDKFTVSAFRRNEADIDLKDIDRMTLKELFRDGKIDLALYRLLKTMGSPIVRSAKKLKEDTR